MHYLKYLSKIVKMLRSNWHSEMEAVKKRMTFSFFLRIGKSFDHHCRRIHIDLSQNTSAKTFFRKRGQRPQWWCECINDDDDIADDEAHSLPTSWHLWYFSKMDFGTTRQGTIAVAKERSGLYSVLPTLFSYWKSDFV